MSFTNSGRITEPPDEPSEPPEQDIKKNVRGIMKNPARIRRVSPNKRRGTL
jgi:hypothetical protein